MLCFLSLPSLQGGEDRFWDKQDTSAWTQDQKTQFLSASPWAKQVTAVLTSNDSNMAGATPRAGGTGSGRRSAVYSSRGNSDSSNGPSLPKFQGLVRWVSASPMQQLLKLKLPDGFKGHYVISVTGLPVGEDSAIVAEQTTLQIKKGEPVHPETAYQDPNDTATIYFAFLPSMLDISGARTAQFSMLAAPFEIRARFNLAEMKIHGEPCL